MEKIFTSLDIRNPGLMTLPPGVERYYVKGGGLSVIEVLPDDDLFASTELDSTSEVIAFNSDRKI